MLFTEHNFSYGVQHSEYDPETSLAPEITDPNIALALMAFRKSTFSGQHDLCEMLGGQGGTLKIISRKGLRPGIKFEISIGFNLLLPDHVQAFWKYMALYRFRVVLAGPPCSAFGIWSHSHRIHAYDAWLASYTVGIKLASLIIEVCLYQLSIGLHFICENAGSSTLWRLPEFMYLAKQANIC